MDDLREKVIKGLGCLAGENEMRGRPCDSCGYQECQTYSICITTLARDALTLLRAQEPVLPKVDIDTYVCGACGTRLERQSLIGPNAILAETFNYCPNCGRKVKWDD